MLAYLAHDQKHKFIQFIGSLNAALVEDCSLTVEILGNGAIQISHIYSYWLNGPLIHSDESVCHLHLMLL